MPADPAQREHRLLAIREILAEGPVPGQAELLARLRARGHEVAQSSISRDLRELGVAKVKGAYVLAPDLEPGTLAGPIPAPAVALPPVVGIQEAGPHLVVVKTAVGAASSLAIAFDQARWPEVVGTVAGDDTVFIATTGRRGQLRLVERLQHLGKEQVAHA